MKLSEDKLSSNERKSSVLFQKEVENGRRGGSRKSVGTPSSPTDDAMNSGGRDG